MHQTTQIKRTVTVQVVSCKNDEHFVPSVHQYLRSQIGLCAWVIAAFCMVICSLLLDGCAATPSKQDQDLVIIIDCPIGVGKERTLYVIVNSILLIYVQDDLESMSGKTLPDPDIDVHWVYTLPEGAVSAIRKAILNISVRRPVDIQEEAEYADEEGEFRCYVQYSRNNIRTVYPGEHQEAVFELVRTINDHIPLSYRIKSKAHG